jgi:DNA-binding CsgD family transcriptional regulator
MLVGRDRELLRISAVFEDARRGRSDALAIVGEPGVGKTALLEEARTLAVDLRLLTATGVESESELPFAGLHELLRPLLQLLPRIPPAQAQQLSAALAIEEGTADPLAVGAGTLSLLVEAAEETPIAVVLDDAHWLDRSSADAVVFATRRLRLEQVALLAAFRPYTAAAFESLPRLDLEPLGLEDARELLRHRTIPVRDADEDRVLAAAAGNPLALLELPVELAQDLPTTTSSHERLQRTFAQRIDALPAEARLGLLLAAAEPDPATVRRAAELQQLEDPLGLSEAAGLIRIGGGDLTFRHPVVRSLAYANAPAEARASAHRALAAALPQESDGDRRAWHLAAAADSPDEGVAALLELTAERASARGGQAAAARALERAARLSPEESDRARRLLAAAQAEREGGSASKARALAEESLSLTDDPLRQADITFLLCVNNWTEKVDDSTLLRQVERPELDDERRVKLLMMVMGWRMDRWDAVGAVELAHRIDAIAGGAGEDWGQRGLTYAGVAYLTAGDFARAADRLRAQATLPAHPTMAGFQYMAFDWFDEVRTSVDETIVGARARGNLQNIVWNRTVAAHLELRCGRLDAAEAAAAEAIALRDILRHDKIEAASTALAAVQAWRGQADACIAAARRAVASARAAEDLEVEGQAQYALALLALGTGRPADAVPELEPLAQRWEASTAGNPVLAAFLPDLVEALAVTGRADEARERLDRFASIAEKSGSVWMRGACTRCEGLLAADDDSDTSFARSLELLEGSQYALELARTRLAFGERLRRTRRAREARLQLQPAFDTFAAAGAVPWRDRAAAELRATGVRVETGERPRTELTPQELHIATLVAQGKTNKEIATAMYLSPKTIEYHLSNTYRKLDIHSRAELTNYIIRQLAAGPQ